MATTNMTAQNFEAVVTAPGTVLIDWWAGWCGPCLAFAPIFEAASEAHPGITFAKIDAEAEKEFAVAANIMSIPTLMLFRDGILLYSQPGALSAEALEDLITQAEALDMDAVRREAAAQEAAGEGE